MRYTLVTLMAAILMPLALWAGPQTAVFQQVEGRVQVVRHGDVKPATAGMVVGQGDEIRCESGSARVILKSDAGHEIRLKGKTRIGLKRFTKDKESHQTLIDLIQGKIWMAVAKLRTPSSTFEVNAGGVICGVRGTQFDAQFDGNKQKGRFGNHEGRVAFTDHMKMTMEVPLKHYCNFKNGVYTDTRPMDHGDLTEFNWK